MKVELLENTPEPEILVAMAAKLCYSEATIDDLWQRMKEEEVSGFINKLMEMGHHSPFEHISFTFGIEGISRVTTHQLVRHRIASYSQQSQRYVKYKFDKSDMSDMSDYTIPSSIENIPELKKVFVETIKKVSNVYQQLVDAGIPAEDARYVLPEGTHTKIMVTMNARELIHFFRLRCCNRAQWEIRQLAHQMLKKIKEVCPNIFVKAGPSCIPGKCLEGKMSCGKPYKLVGNELCSTN